MSIPSGNRRMGRPGTPSRSHEKRFHQDQAIPVSKHGFSAGIIGATIVEYVAEIKKPDEERLDGYHEAQLDATRFDLFSPAPIYPAFEIARMTALWNRHCRGLGPDNPFVKQFSTDALRRLPPQKL